MLRSAALAFVVVLLGAACAAPPNAATGASPGQSPSSVAAPAAGSPTASSETSPTTAAAAPSGNGASAFVLVDRGNGGDSSHYKLALVGIDGRVIKVLTPDEPSFNQTSQSPAAPPLISISSSRIYYLDGDSSVGYIARDGSTGLAATLPGGPKKVVSFAVNPDDTRIAYAIFDYTSGGPAVSISIQDLVGGGNKVEIYSSANNAEWPVAWNQGNLVLAVGSSQVSQPSGSNPFAVPNPYNATNGYQVVDTLHNPGLVLDSIPAQCAYGLLVDAGSPCSEANGGVGVRGWTGTTTWYPNSREANFGMREGLAPNGTVAANSSPGSVGLFAASGKIVDFMSAIKGSAVSMGWVDSAHLVVRRFSDGSAGSAAIVEPDAGIAIDIALNCGPLTAPVACADPVMFGTI